MFNPVMLTQLVRNPQAGISQLINNSQIMQNPIGRNAIEMYQRGNIQGINELAQNLCKEKGTSLEQMTKQIKSQMGMN